MTLRKALIILFICIAYFITISLLCIQHVRISNLELITTQQQTTIATLRQETIEYEQRCERMVDSCLHIITERTWE